MNQSLASRGNRGKTFYYFEDQTLCSSFLNIAQEQLCVPQRMHTTFWARVSHDYNEKIHVEERHRTSGSLRNRWCTIRTEVAKFCGCLAEVQPKHQGETAEADLINEAKGKFFEIHKRRFLFENCWNFLRSHSNWEELITMNKQSSKIPSSLSHLAQSTSFNSVPSTSATSTPNTPGSFDSEFDHRQALLGEGSSKLAYREDEKESPKRDYEDMVETPSSQEESAMKSRDYEGTSEMSSGQKESLKKNQDDEGTAETWCRLKESSMKHTNYEGTTEISSLPKELPKRKRNFESTIETQLSLEESPKKRRNYEGILETPFSRNLGSSTRARNSLFNTHFSLLFAGMMCLMSSRGAY